MQDHTVSIEADGGAGRLVFAPRFNAATAFVDRHLAEGRGAKAAIRTAGGDVTYAMLAERVARCGNALKALGVAPGGRVLMAVLDRPEFFYLFWGAIKAGMVAVPLNTLLRSADYRYMIADSEAALVVWSEELAAELEPAIAEARPSLSLTTGQLAALMEGASPVLDPAPTGPLDDCFWLYTSGSTGRPKGAVHRQRDLAVSARRYGVETLGAREDDVFYSAAKLFFAYGLGNAMGFPLWVGGTSVLAPERPTAESTFATIERFRPTLFFGVPTLYARQIAEFEGRRPDLSSLRLCASAGEALPAHLYSAWHRLTGLEILDGIGSTEAAHMYVSNRPGEVVAGSTGHPVPGYRVKIVDEAGAEQPPGEPGRLLIQGDSIARCYWHNPKPTLVDGWFDTGDTYRADADGTLTYSGRSDDMLKVGGIWCSPIEIEATLIEHPQVLEAAVVGRADGDGLIKPEAWIVPKDPRAAADPALADSLVRHCKSRLAPYKYPRWVQVVDDLPKTATGKIQRFRLRAAAGEAAETAPEAGAEIRRAG